MSVFVVLITFSIPWFLWGSAAVVAGLPVWLWWHIGWLGVTAVVFALFSRTEWDRLVGATSDPTTGTDGGDRR
jgi:hypothetical protein